MEEVLITIDDVFEMAIGLERDGARFYRAAALVVDDRNVARLLEALADTEHTHHTQLVAMRKEMRRYAGLNRTDGLDEITSGFVRGWASNVGFDVSNASEFAKGKNVGDVLRAGIEFEDAARTLYVGFRGVVEKVTDVDWLDQLIKDEEAHADSLKRTLQTLREKGLLE